MLFRSGCSKGPPGVGGKDVVGEVGPGGVAVLGAGAGDDGDQLQLRHEMKRLNPADYEGRQLEDFSKYVFGMSYQTLKDVMKQQKGREEQCRKQGCWWKRKEQLAKKQYHTGSTCR